MFREMRRSRQQISDAECKKILHEEWRAALAVQGDDGYPYALPIDFYYAEDEGRIYFHCAKEGHKIDAMKRSDKVSFTTWTKGYIEEGHWEYTVHSVIVFGRVHEITDPEMIADRVRTFARKYYPSEEEITRVMDGHLKHLKLFAIDIEHMTGKIIHES